VNELFSAVATAPHSFRQGFTPPSPWSPSAHWHQPAHPGPTGHCLLAALLQLPVLPVLPVLPSTPKLQPISRSFLHLLLLPCSSHDHHDLPHL
jgi:hypothetical protein